MQTLINTFKEHVIELSSNKGFIHHEWFIEYHLDIVEQIALELCDLYPDADRDLVHLLVWLHDYWKIVDFDNEYKMTLIQWKKKLSELGFEEDIIEKALWFVEIMDQNESLDISKTAIEIQIISSADWCSHFVWPFLKLWWYENSDKDYKELMKDNIYKIQKDWNKKIVLPEAREAFQKHYELALEWSWTLPERYLNKQ